MIKSDIEMGGCVISGSSFELILDLAFIIKNIRTTLCEAIPQEVVDEAIAFAGRMAYTPGFGDDEDTTDALCKELNNVCRETDCLRTQE